VGYQINNMPDPEWLKLTGGYNDYPPGWRRITTKQFAQSKFFSFNPVWVETRQMLSKAPGAKGSMTPAILHHYWDDTGVAMVHDYRKGTVYYYAFGCAHDYTTGKCSKCGRSADNFDTSD